MQYKIHIMTAFIELASLPCPDPILSGNALKLRGKISWTMALTKGTAERL